MTCWHWRPHEDSVLMSTTIKRLNEQFGTKSLDNDRYFFEQVREPEFQNVAFEVLAREIFAAVRGMGGE